MSWVKSLCEDTAGDVVAIDGKTLRRSFDQAAGKTALHMVSAWAADSGLTLGQTATEQKSNEITAIPKLMELLDIRGATVTIDAMGCQKKIAEQIIKQEGDYMLGLKGNQGTLHDEVKLLMDEAVEHDFAHMQYDFHETVDGDHGRIEHRKVWCTHDVDWFKDKDQWPGLRSFVMVESQRTVGEKTTGERRYFISSLDGTNAKRAAHAIRTHWGIENSVHWILDVAFNEDRCRVREGNAAENMSLLRRIALNLLKNNKSIKVGVKSKRLKAGWDEQYLLDVLKTKI
jgi:predicted transposase YbfD/YdcC